MKTKLKYLLATSGLIIATLTFSNCGNENGHGQNGSHHMGNHRTYQPMKDQDMPARKSSSSVP